VFSVPRAPVRTLKPKTLKNLKNLENLKKLKNLKTFLKPQDFTSLAIYPSLSPQANTRLTIASKENMEKKSREANRKLGSL